MEPIEFDIGKAIVDAGYTWSDGNLRDNHTVKELVEKIIHPVLVQHGVILE